MSDCMSMVLQLFISALITMLVLFPTIFLRRSETVVVLRQVSGGFLVTLPLALEGCLAAVDI